MDLLKNREGLKEFLSQSEKEAQENIELSIQNQKPCPRCHQICEPGEIFCNDCTKEVWEFGEKEFLPTDVCDLCHSSGELIAVETASRVRLKVCDDCFNTTLPK